MKQGWQQQQQRLQQQQRRNMAGAAWLEQKRRQQEQADGARAAPLRAGAGKASVAEAGLRGAGRASEEHRRGSKLRALFLLVVGLGVTAAAGLATGAIIATVDNHVLPFLAMYAVWAVGLILTLRWARHSWRGY